MYGTLYLIDNVLKIIIKRCSGEIYIIGLYRLQYMIYSITLYNRSSLVFYPLYAMPIHLILYGISWDPWHIDTNIPVVQGKSKQHGEKKKFTSSSTDIALDVTTLVKPSKDQAA